jgi:diguanylate cyclase (GGDEF)-like protein
MIRLIKYISIQPKSDIMAIGIIGVILIGYANHQAGLEFSASIFYLLPVALVSWCAGRREGGFIALCSSVSWSAAEFYAGRDYSHPIICYWNMVVMFGFFFIVNFALSGFKRALEEEKHLARVDSLTGVGNARCFLDLAKKEIERTRRYRHPVTVLYLDCDNFKNVNDNFGHQIGNRLLRLLASNLQNLTRTTDIVARLGGDEFAVLMPETGEDIVPKAIQRLHSRLVDSLRKKGWPITLSMGAAIYLHPPESAEELIKSADRLMLQAKNQGKNTVKYQVFDIPPVDVRSIPTLAAPFPSGPWPDSPVPPAGLDGLLLGSPPKNAVSPPA